MTREIRNKAIPVRFTDREMTLIDQMVTRTGLKRAEVIRRCVRLVEREIQKLKSVGFILDDLDDLGPDNFKATLALNESSKKYGK